MKLRNPFRRRPHWFVELIGTSTGTVYRTVDKTFRSDQDAQTWIQQNAFGGLQVGGDTGLPTTEHLRYVAVYR